MYFLLLTTILNLILHCIIIFIPPQQYRIEKGHISKHALTVIVNTYLQRGNPEWTASLLEWAWSKGRGGGVILHPKLLLRYNCY